MTNYETDTDLIDESVVRRMFEELDVYQKQEDHTNEWSEAFTDAQAYTGDLYATFTPELTPKHQAIGKLLGGITLAYAELAYGKDETTPKLYRGSHEDGLLATYHHAAHPKRFIGDMFQYAAARNLREPGTFTEEDYMRFPLIGGAHDAMMGNGRGNDERQSALFGGRLLQKLGIALNQDTCTKTAIEATTWDVATASQAVDPSKGFVAQQEAAAVADLLPMFDQRGIYVSLTLAPEIFMDKAHGHALTVEARKAGFELAGASVDGCFNFFDQNEPARELFAPYLDSLATFYENFTPADPNLDSMFPGRSENIDFARELNRAFKRRQLNALETLRTARSFMEGE